jgi:serine/threonine-protein kinase
VAGAPLCVGVGETVGAAAQRIRGQGLQRALVVDDAGHSTGVVMQLADWRARLPDVVGVPPPALVTPSGPGGAGEARHTPANVSAMLVAPPPRGGEEDTVNAVQLLPWLLELMRASAQGGAALDELEHTRRAVGLGQQCAAQALAAPPERGQPPSPPPQRPPPPPPPLPPPLPAEAVRAADPYLGLRAGCWQLVERIGTGGMGAVYRATHPSGRVQAAVKLLLPALARDAFMVARFLREARTEKLIADERVVRIFDCGRTDDGTPYFAMELLDGVPLHHLLHAEGRLGMRRALEIAREIAGGLAAAHRAGVVHRDLKPSNVVLARDAGAEHVKILDFGIAKLRGGDGDVSSVTAADMRMGTPYYMAPEQILGGEVDARTDIYAFGVLVFQLLSGALPFPAPPEEAMRRHVLERAPRLSEAGVAAPAALDDLVARCLRKAKSERPESFEEVGAALAALLAAEDQDLSPGGAALGSFARPRTTSAWVMAALAAVAFVAGTGLGRRTSGTVDHGSVASVAVRSAPADVADIAAGTTAAPASAGAAALAARPAGAPHAARDRQRPVEEAPH